MKKCENCNKEYTDKKICRNCGKIGENGDNRFLLIKSKEFYRRIKSTKWILYFSLILIIGYWIFNLVYGKKSPKPVIFIVLIAVFSQLAGFLRELESKNENFGFVETITDRSSDDV